MTATALAGEPYDNSGLRRPPANATGLTAIRILANGTMRQYSGVEFDHGYVGVERFIRRLAAFGYIKPSSSAKSYGVLDVLDKDGDIIADYDIPTANAFAYMKRKLNLTVERHDEDEVA